MTTPSISILRRSAGAFGTVLMIALTTVPGPSAAGKAPASGAGTKAAVAVAAGSGISPGDTKWG